MSMEFNKLVQIVRVLEAVDDCQLGGGQFELLDMGNIVAVLREIADKLEKDFILTDD